MAANSSCDWQISCKEIKERGDYLLRSGQWADCNFLVGSEPNQVQVKGHKLILAMASPVFEAMFYGGMAERNDPIPILDVQPDAFKALLEYMYTDNININSFDKACELCYGAKKYMLPHLVEECTRYLWSDLNPKNACRAYEFAKLFEEPILMDKCLQIICTQTMEVLSEVSFEEVEIGTVVTVFAQNYLNIESELELFDAAVRYNNAQSYNLTSPAPLMVHPVLPALPAAPLPPPPSEPLEARGAPAEGPSEPSEMEQPAIDLANSTDNPVVTCSNKNPESTSDTCQQPQQSSSSSTLTIRNALQKIRFLTLTPQQFASGLSRSSLLSQAEAFAILMNISSPCCGVPMPPGFSSTTEPRRKALFRPVSFVVDSPSPVLGEPAAGPLPASPALPLSPHGMCPNPRDKFYCRRSIVHQTDRLNNSILDCSVTFTVDRNICVIGIQVPTQGLGEDPLAMPTSGQYSELLYAHLLDADGSRLTYTHYTSRVPYRSLLEITFNRPFYIQRNKVYKVGVTFNKMGWYPLGVCCQTVMCDQIFFNFGVGQSSDSVYKVGVVFNKVGWYPLGVCCQTVVCDQVFFSFGVGQSSDSVRDGLIRSIIFTY